MLDLTMANLTMMVGGHLLFLVLGFLALTFGVGDIFPTEQIKNMISKVNQYQNKTPAPSPPQPNANAEAKIKANAEAKIKANANAKIKANANAKNPVAVPTIAVMSTTSTTSTKK